MLILKGLSFTAPTPISSFYLVLKLDVKNDYE